MDVFLVQTWSLHSEWQGKTNITELLKYITETRLIYWNSDYLTSEMGLVFSDSFPGASIRDTPQKLLWQVGSKKWKEPKSKQLCR